MKSYILFDHQQKSAAYNNALREKYKAISRTSPAFREASFVLSDNDVLSRRTRLESLYSAGVRNFFVYPHAGRPSLVADFYEPWERTTASFAATEDHIRVMRIAGSRGNIHSVGWSLCDIAPFVPKPDIKNILFAPIHPRNSIVDRNVNYSVFAKLLKIVDSCGVPMQVRYLSPFAGNGIPKVEHPLVSYIEGAAGPDVSQIDQADIVVAHQTFAMLAVARGIPTLMMGEDIVPHAEHANGKYLEAKRWNEYKDLIMYPLDILYSDDPVSLMLKALRSDSPIADWKRRMIGESFNPKLFVDILESYL